MILEGGVTTELDLKSLRLSREGGESRIRGGAQSGKKDSPKRERLIKKGETDLIRSAF